MEPAFRIALGISLALHSALAAPLLQVHRSRDSVRPDKEIVIDYVVLEEPAPAKVPETPRVEVAKYTDIKPTAAREDPTADARPEETPALAEARRQAKVRATKDYINYYQLIREKIRDRLKAHYRNYFAEGEVNLEFILSADGRLRDVRIDTGSSTADRTLHEMAARSVRDASPFPAFPKALALPQMSFNLQVSFKRE